MDSLLDAIQEGRLIELPDNDKHDSLQFLAHIIEAIPSVPNDTDVAGLVLTREENIVTALGKGFACPHARVGYDEDLIASIGWSPTGIDYGSPDNKPIHIIIMYLVPDNQRNHYLREVSLLAKALQNSNNFEALKQADDLNTVRNYLLDLVSLSKSISGFEARAKMIKLETREALPPAPIDQLSNVIIEPVSLVSLPNKKHFTLAQNKELINLLDTSPQLIDSIAAKGVYETAGWRIIKRNVSEYLESRLVYECLAIKVMSGKKGN
jgi:mannitol/fructose-specific phosphotransferase system IIA component (Ntr-type)